MGPDFHAPRKGSTGPSSAEDRKAWEATQNNLLTQEGAWAIPFGIALIGVVVIGIIYLLVQSGAVDPK